ncbi:MAG: patatin-like phospholipase family protein [Prolixibacteraceae bacterium]|jgi:predicted acylesterase/phospholipase RssA|nr:patatin-like phospholipase family protein [Prolixibacteraceae bacterium]
MENQPTFRIGISMAGAVSAGAYTAGVMDYLLEALESWQKAKDLGLPGTPKHNVVIEVLTGASAGGMTAVITAAAIQKEFPHINAGNYFNTVATENPLYDSWVNLTEEAKSDMMSQMLDSSDITSSPELNPKQEVRSLFNSLFIEKIARRTLDNTTKTPAASRPYFADDLELLTTLTNLRGYNYELEFITATGKREDRMTMHKDLVHFQLNPSGEYQEDGKIPFHFNTPDGLNKDLLVDAAIATGAFPGGLAPRVVTRDPKFINDNHLLKITHGKEFLVDPLAEYNAVCVDGGVINNEPYDLTETIMTDRRKDELRRSSNSEKVQHFQLPRSAADFDSTILMIDPFPSEDDKPDANYYDLQALKFTVPQLFGAMRQQLMVKTDLLEKAYSDTDYTRFMVAPIRTKKGKVQKQSVACGSLGGFGGFFSKQFRIHDFLLGRRNCQRFIQQYFCVPVSANHPIIKFGFEDLSSEAITMMQVNNGISLPIIPDIRIAKDQKSLIPPPEEEEFPYPTISLKYLLNLQKKIQTRFGVVLDSIKKGNNPEDVVPEVNQVVQKIRKKSWLSRVITSPIADLATDGFLGIAKYAGKKIAAEKFIDAVIADMDERGLLKKD